MKRLVYKHDDVLLVFSFGKTQNKKISTSKRKIVQTFTYSMDQVNYVRDNEKVDFATFYKLANANCMDCPFRDYGKCYTHKFFQTRGFVMQLKSILRNNEIREIPKATPKDL